MNQPVYTCVYQSILSKVMRHVIFEICFSVFPKTDYTYSEKSECRYEIAPGILAMPNMSRRSIHSDGETFDQASRDPSVNVTRETVNFEDNAKVNAENSTVGTTGIYEFYIDN